MTGLSRRQVIAGAAAVAVAPSAPAKTIPTYQGVPIFGDTFIWSGFSNSFPVIPQRTVEVCFSSLIDEYWAEDWHGDEKEEV